MRLDNIVNQLPSYIKPDNFVFIPKNPECYEKDDAILGIYYNILYPEENQIFEQNILCEWLQNPNDNFFPFEEERFEKTAPFFLGRTPINVFEGIFAEIVLELLIKGFSLDDAIKYGIASIKEKVLPPYKKKAQIVSKLQKSATDNSLKMRYKILFDAINSCCVAPEKELGYSIHTYKEHKDDKILHSLLEGAILKKGKLVLPESNRWDHRIKPLKEAIEKVRSFAPNCPYFLAFQEVTPQSYEDLKLVFPELDWISYNTTTGEETRNIGEEKMVGEFLSFTATLGLSKGLKAIKMALHDLPSVSGSLRKILGVEVIHEASKQNFVIFTIHTDYLVKDNLYEKNVESIADFVKDFASGLPFIFGGDLNAFENNGGEDFICNLKKSVPFIESEDYRSGPFYSSPHIAYSTFLGHVLDSFKTPIEEKDGLVIVRPNALDHIFLNHLHILFGVREAGVYDEAGHIVDPFASHGKFLERLKERKTASDHFLNAVLFSI